MATRNSGDLGRTVNVREVLDPQLWRERYAFGLPVGQTLDERKTAKGLFAGIPDETIRWHLRAALSEAEMHLGVELGIEVLKARPVDDGLVKGRDYDREVERLPYTKAEEARFFRIDLPHGPVISVERVRAYYWDTLIWEFSTTGSSGSLQNILLEWKKSGTLHIIPANMQAFMVTPNNAWGTWYTINLSTGPIPGVWAVDYTVGPNTKDRPGEIPVVLAHWCYAVAGILLLSMGGLAQSKGLTSTSLSFDGFSKSVSLQASAIYGINSALEEALDKATKRIDWKALRSAYGRGMRVRLY